MQNIVLRLLTWTGFLQATPIQFFPFEQKPIFSYKVQCKESYTTGEEKIFPDKEQLVVDIIIDESNFYAKVYYGIQCDLSKQLETMSFYIIF